MLLCLKWSTLDVWSNPYINVIEVDNIWFKNWKIYLEWDNNRSITDWMKFKVVSRFRWLEWIKFFDDKWDNQWVSKSLKHSLSMMNHSGIM